MELSLLNSSVNADHSPPPQPKVNIICQSLHQEEIIQELTMKLRHIGDSIDHRMAQEVRHWFPQQGPLCWVERANRTVGTKYLGCPEISRTHGLMMSRLPNIRS